MKIKETLLMYAIENGGLRKAIKGVSLLVGMEIFVRQEGREPESVIEYAFWWKTGYKSVYRELHDFRACFPGYDHPLELLEELRLAKRGIELDEDREKAFALVAGLPWSLAA
jgi:hypothetical protein